MSRFRVGISRDFFKPDGALAFPSLDLTRLKVDPAIECEFLPSGSDASTGYELLARDLDGYDAIIPWTERITKQSASKSGQLALVRRWGAGFEKIDVSACTDAGIALAIARDGVRRPVAVMLLTLILAVTGRLLIKDRLVRAGPDSWGKRIDHMGVGLVGRTLGLLGAGNTGVELFRLAKPLDMVFIAHDPYADSETLRSLGVRMVGLEDLFRESDVLAISCPLNEETYHLVNAGRLSLMKPTAFLVNGARGPIVDQKALVEALQSGRIAGAGLDVLEREPPDPDDPIVTLDNVILNPHALCWTDQCFADCFAEAVDGVLDLMHGRVPKGIVNREILQQADWRRKLASYRERFGA
jgi:phosphoglycerate dehydrogenase-like enzyme